MTTDIQTTLNKIGYQREFTVVFTKKDGTERRITGFMEFPENGEPRQTIAMPIKITKGENAGQWRSFRLDSVKEIIA